MKGQNSSAVRELNLGPSRKRDLDALTLSYVARQAEARERLTFTYVNTEPTRSELVTSPVEAKIDNRFYALTVAL